MTLDSWATTSACSAGDRVSAAALALADKHSANAPTSPAWRIFADRILVRLRFVFLLYRVESHPMEMLWGAKASQPANRRLSASAPCSSMVASIHSQITRQVSAIWLSSITFALSRTSTWCAPRLSASMAACKVRGNTLVIFQRAELRFAGQFSTSGNRQVHCNACLAAAWLGCRDRIRS
jgi:hypothetical protein